MGHRVYDLSTVIAAVREQGWQVTVHNMQYKMVPPNPEQPMVFGPATQPSPRAMRNLVTQLRRSGLEY